jgi:hypothetical protein
MYIVLTHVHCLHLCLRYPSSIPITTGIYLIKPKSTEEQRRINRDVSDASPNLLEVPDFVGFAPASSVFASPRVLLRRKQSWTWLVLLFRAKTEGRVGCLKGATVSIIAVGVYRRGRCQIWATRERKDELVLHLPLLAVSSLGGRRCIDRLQVPRHAF